MPGAPGAQEAPTDSTMPTRPTGGGPGGRSNILVERFLATDEFAALYAEAQETRTPGTLDSVLYRGPLDAAPERLQPTVAAVRSTLRHHDATDLPLSLRIRSAIPPDTIAGIAAAKQNGTRFGRPLSDPAVIADKLAIAADARAKGRTAEDAARLVGWSRATLYRHQQALASRESVTM